jgi:hypothetical protein
MDDQESTSQAPDSQTAVTLQVKKRPWSVTLLAGIVLIITIINLIRFVLSIRYWTFLASRSAVSPLYLAITGLVWSVAGAALLWGLWTAKSWAPRLMQAVGLSYALYYWLDLVFLKEHPINGAAGTIRALLPTNWQFSAAVTLVLLAYMVWALGRPKVKAYFGEVPSAD